MYREVSASHNVLQKRIVLKMLYVHSWSLTCILTCSQDFFVKDYRQPYFLFYQSVRCLREVFTHDIDYVSLLMLGA